jgi:hypothetical protein
MLKSGIVALVTSVLTIVGISVVLVSSAGSCAPGLLALPILWLMARWFRPVGRYHETATVRS